MGPLNERWDNLFRRLQKIFGQICSLNSTVDCKKLVGKVIQMDIVRQINFKAILKLWDNYFT